MTFQLHFPTVHMAGFINNFHHVIYERPLVTGTIAGTGQLSTGRAYTCTRAYTPPPPAGPRTQPAEVQPHEIFLTAQQIFFTATKYTNIFPIIISVLKCIFTTTLAADILFRRIAFCLHCEILFTI